MCRSWRQHSYALSQVECLALLTTDFPRQYYLEGLMLCSLCCALNASDCPTMCEWSVPAPHPCPQHHGESHLVSSQNHGESHLVSSQNGSPPDQPCSSRSRQPCAEVCPWQPAANSLARESVHSKCSFICSTPSTSASLGRPGACFTALTRSSCMQQPTEPDFLWEMNQTFPHEFHLCDAKCHWKNVC